MERTIVRCERGGLYSTLWWPWGSFKAIRLGPTRIQRCPIHHKWEKTRQVDVRELSPSEIADAEAVTDSRII
ncbi:hypothetical protein GCM10027169_11470 [Gordonia jinhuaensis]|uniref:Uncharacterized protein n=1 Tax=Gordonia jinhuaensis TaxID=1517702 RepID=A0A916T4F2_9ACTN|nr:hypothetical protein [Gordonia jinhuaensis]GGB31307.1 hypothetical protein GCM10011489_19390 [Gordonia jinhuaensis]